jgi:hypothetical protein
MPRPALEVADIFRDHGAAWRKANAGHVSLEQLKVMSAIESCRTAALGGHVALCEKCAHIHVAYNSCLMGKFRNGELGSSFIELSVNFRDFALHYESPPSDRLSVPWIKGSFAQTRWSFALDLIEILVNHDGAWRFNGCKISWIQSAATPSECVESSTARSRASRISAVNRCNGE